MIEDSGIEVIANYLFGLPGDTIESMQKTFNLSLDLCTVAWNGYPVMALPGSSMYRAAIQQGYEPPKSYSGYSFLGYETVPLPTESLSSEEILRFRDEAFTTYHAYPPFIEKIRQRFGDIPVENIQKMLNVKLKRKLLEENQ